MLPQREFELAEQWTDKLWRLPRWAMVAFITRCVRRVECLTGHREVERYAIHDWLKVAEQRVSSGGQDKEVAEQAFRNKNEIYESNLLRLKDGDTPQDAAQRAVAFTIDIADCAHLLPDLNGAARHVVGSVLYAAEAVGNDFTESLERDYQLLLKLSDINQWDNDSPIPPNLFALHSEFCVLHESDSPIISVGPALHKHLLSSCHQDPERLYTLTPRKFEELVAELFYEFGFDVELTVRTKDGGRDIVALGYDRAGIGLKYLIECKRYGRGKKVGVQVVRSLHGVVTDEGATKGILATTAKFSKPATEHLARNRWLLEGKDYDDLVGWLDIYQQHQMARVSFPVIMPP